MDNREQTIEQIASICHEANRRYCETIGDRSQVEWHEAPSWQQQSAVDGVTAIADGRINKPSQSHESWCAEKVAHGWTYGEVKDPEAKTHPCLKAFADLPPEQQAKDELFFAIATALLRANGLLVDPAPFHIGDVVSLVSHPLIDMTVHSITQAEDGSFVCMCMWFDQNGQLFFHPIDARALVGQAPAGRKLTAVP